MSVVGGPVYPEEGADDVDEEMHILRALTAPEELWGEREAEAVDLTRAPFAAGATPSEARATVAE
eukprot:11935186-Alexandrium_andersonii.AAC.1